MTWVALGLAATPDNENNFEFIMDSTSLVYCMGRDEPVKYTIK